MTSSESSNPVSTTQETRAHRVSKRKHHNAQMPSNPRPPRTFSVQPLQTNTKEFLQVYFPFFPQYTYYHKNTNNDQRSYLKNMPCFLHFHGPHFIISVTLYHSHFIITQTKMNCVTFDYIT